MAELASDRIRDTPERWNEWRKRGTAVDLRHADLRRLSLVGFDLRGVDLTRADLTDAQLEGVDFSGCTLAGACFDGARLRKADFRQAQFSRPGQGAGEIVRFQEADLRGAQFADVDLRTAQFADANLGGASFRRADLRGVDFHWSDLSGCDFRDANLAGVNLSYCNLSSADLRRAALNGADLSLAHFAGANLLGCDLRDILFHWAESPTELRQARNLLLARVSDNLAAELGFPAGHNENAAKLDFRSYPLESANFEAAQFSRAAFENVQALGSNWRGAQLEGAKFASADLRDADFSGAALCQADLSSADLGGANLTGARLEGANLQRARLAFARGLSAEQVLAAHNAHLAFYDPTLLASLGLPDDHNERLAANDLRGYDLRDAKLAGADLTSAMLIDAQLDGACLDGARLCKANLENARLCNASLVKADLSGALLPGAQLREADMRDADLRQAEFLSTRQLAGTNVAGAKLPDNVRQFEALASIRESSDNVRKIFVSLQLLAVYAGLTVASTRDVALLTNAGTLQLPILQTSIPIGWFYWVVPALLLGVYLYCHFALQNLWEELAQLPAYFPDGRPLHQRVYPWIMNTVARAHFARLRPERGLLSRLQYGTIVLLTWWVVPAAEVLLWLRYLARHEWWGTVLHITLVALSFAAAFFFLRMARSTLSGSRTLVGRRDLLLAVPFACALIVVGVVSFGAIEGRPGHGAADPRTWVPAVFDSLHIPHFAQLSDEDVSMRPATWAGEDPPCGSVVRGARLAGRNLRGAVARNAFLACADLTGVNLDHADLRGADLRRANLTGASLAGANLAGARLEGAIVPTGPDTASQ